MVTVSVLSKLLASSIIMLPLVASIRARKMAPKFSEDYKLTIVTPSVMVMLQGFRLLLILGYFLDYVLIVFNSFVLIDTWQRLHIHLNLIKLQF